MSKRLILWILFAVVSAGCLIFAYEYFPKSFPLLTLDLKMDRTTALQASQEAAHQHGWGPEGYRQAASFRLDSRTQYFVELEAGGVDAFREMMKGELYSPYTWRVRNFLEGETNETEIRFTPQGEPYGFRETLPEDQPGAALGADSARLIAEHAAVNDWRIDLTAYELIEQSEEIRPGGRVDHKLVYERPEPKIGEGHYRLRLTVGGDRLTGLTHFVEIPEAFSRRYDEMRSANDTIATISLVAIAILYVLGGIVIGLFFLLKQRWLIWRQPLYWGLFVAFVQVLSGINQWPLAWMNYDTALSSQLFLIQQIVQLLLIFIGSGLLYTLAFMAAESLTRKAFPNHIRFWKLWSPEVAASSPVLGQTISGYLMVSIFLAFDIALYFLATKLFGWWTPSGALFDPDTLATYFPWLDSIAISLQAGFMEECLFRAIPIAGAALIGRRLGQERYWIIGAFVVQALIFGSGHANYPNQPSYARVVELIIPSIGFGLVYLYYGLLPAIILHYVVDVVWIGLPIFAASSPGIWFDQMMIIILALVPLLVILRGRLSAGKWCELKLNHFNRSWKPAEIEATPSAPTETKETPTLSDKTMKLLIVGGLSGLVLWFLASTFINIAPSLSMNRGEAEKAAQTALTERGIELTDKFERLSCVDIPLDEGDRFIWQEGDEETYRVMIGQYLAPPEWHVRYVQFEGDVAERAEEYQIFLTDDGEIPRFYHKLPEARSGATLTEEEARRMAHEVLIEKYEWNPYVLKEVAAIPSKLPERTDWIFKFADTINYKLDQGEARILIEIADDEVVDSYSFIHVPEEWEREDRSRQNMSGIFAILHNMAIIFIFIAGIGGAVVGWSRGKFSVRFFLTLFIPLFVIMLLKSVLGWPCIKAGFTTSQPLSNQILITLAVSVMALLFVSGGVSLVGGFIQKWKRRQGAVRKALAVPSGLLLGFLISGLAALVSMLFEPSLEPAWGHYTTAGSMIPILSGAVSPLSGLITRTVLFLLVLTALDKFTDGWCKRKVLMAVLFVLTAILLGDSSSDNLPFLLLYGAVMGIIYLLAYIYIFRYQMALMPLVIAGTFIMVELKKAIVAAHPASLPGAIMAIVLILLLSIFWFKKLNTAD